MVACNVYTPPRLHRVPSEPRTRIYRWTSEIRRFNDNRKTMTLPRFQLLVFFPTLVAAIATTIRSPFELFHCCLDPFVTRPRDSVIHRPTFRNVSEKGNKRENCIVVRSSLPRRASSCKLRPEGPGDRSGSSPTSASRSQSDHRA